MRPINTYEAIGIFVSVAVMAVILVVLKYNDSFEVASVLRPESQQGSLIVAGEDTQGEQSGLADALVEAAGLNGELERLVIDDIRIGTGNEVKKGDTVTVHYIGSTQNGIQFDSSYSRGETFSFTAGEGRVIEGWEKGILGMQVGGQRILVIPPDMGYGDIAVGPIPARSNLVFAIELLSIE